MPLSVVGLGGGEAVGRGGEAVGVGGGESVQADQAAASSAITSEAIRPASIAGRAGT